MTDPVIHGDVDDGFGPLADAFAANFRDRGELGAAVSLYVDGVRRVDLWGGVADASSGRPWTLDTLQLVFSSTKGIAALCVARLVQAGRLAVTDRVADHWPEFAAAGKEAITVEQLLSHQAGLIAVDPPLDFDQLTAVTPIVEALAAQAPMWEPGTAHGYHAITFGWLVGELIARVDGRRIGQYVADEIAGPLGLDMWIGLPAALEDRVARIEAARPPSDPEVIDLLARQLGRGTHGLRALTMDGRISTAGDNHFNSRALHATEMPGVNGITDARSLARMYAATVGEVDGVRLLDHDTMQSARTERVNGDDLTLAAPTRFGAGFQLHNEFCDLVQDGSFGHPGAGGAIGFANPELGIGFAYVMNQMDARLVGSPRTLALTRSILPCLDRAQA